MSTESKGIYHWKLGDVALARVCQKAYARVRVVKDEKGLFYDDKVLGISGNEDGSITVTKELCYYVETCRTNHRFWLPYTSLHLAERSRPFYGTDKEPNKVKNEVPSKTPAMLRKRTMKEEHVVPLEVKQNKIKDPDLNTTYDKRIQHVPTEQGKYETAFKEFVRRGKEKIFDRCLNLLKSKVDRNKDCKYLLNVLLNASTEDQFEFVIKAIVTEKEIDNYLHQCWRYNFEVLEDSEDGSELDDITEPESPSKEAEPVTVHTPWCLVCGEGEDLQDCVTCPAAFHVLCRREWLLTVIHRKKPSNKVTHKEAPPITIVEKILSSTRAKCTILNNEYNRDKCPSCMWGPSVGYDDIVWNKLGTCGWWPARVLTPGQVPPCLHARTHTQHDWPLKYYGTRNHSWGGRSRTCLFLPSHTGALAAPDTALKDAVMDANDDYITVYLT